MIMARQVLLMVPEGRVSVVEGVLENRLVRLVIMGLVCVSMAGVTEMLGWIRGSELFSE
jgi:hypothetical protein